MRPEVLCDIRQKSWCLVARRLDDMTLERSQGLLHPRVPDGVIPSLGWFLQEDIVADWLQSYQAQPPGKGFILGRRDISRHHVSRQAPRLLVAVGHDRFFHPLVDPLLCPIGGAHKPIEASHLQEETDESKTTRTDFDKHHMECQRQAVEEGEARNALKELDHLRTGIKLILPRTPCLQRSAGNLKPLGALTLGKTLGLQDAILLEECSASAPLPSSVTVKSAPWWRIVYSAHRSLLTQP